MGESEKPGAAPTDHFYDRDAKPITYEQWTQLRRSSPIVDGISVYKRVALDQVGDVSVSTVWIGEDAMFGSGEAPMIFETMTFSDGSSPELVDRYSTLASAEAGHAAAVAAVRSGK